MNGNSYCPFAKLDRMKFSGFYPFIYSGAADIKE